MTPHGGHIAVLLVPAQDRAFRQGQEETLGDRDVGLDGLPARPGKRTFVSEIECMAVLVGMSIQVDLESEPIPKRTAGQPDQEPREAVVAAEIGFWEVSSS